MTSSTTQNTQEQDVIADIETVVTPEDVTSVDVTPEDVTPEDVTPEDVTSVDVMPAEQVSEPEAEVSEPTQPAKPVDKRSESEKLQSAIHGTSYKDQPTLLALKRRLERLLQSDAQIMLASDVTAGLNALLEQRLTEYDNWQKKLVQEIEQGIAQVSARIADGKVTEAQSQLDRNHNLLKRINADDQARLLAIITPLREELARLLDWKKFASSEKKKELIEKMQALMDNTTQPAQKAKLIRALQDEWKTLGHSDDNDALWTQFSEFARVAFEPCKTYFKDRKDQQAGNLIARNNICEQLEAYAVTITDGVINLNELTRLENQAREDWKKYAPVAQNKINALQERFNAVLTVLRQHRRQAMQSHNAAKAALIEQAKALVSSDDVSAAIQQAKSLQQQWKDLGPGSFKDDRKLWTDFRAACDALFARRDEISKEKRQQGRTNSNTSPAKEILKSISALLALDDESFSDSRAKFTALSDAFKEALTPDLKNERKVLQEQFSKLSRQFDTRLRATPDRKTMQLLNQVQAQANFCRDLEELLSAGSTITESVDVLEQQWTAFEKVTDDTLEQLLKKRFQQLLKLQSDNESWVALAEKQELRARELCVEAEIMIGADTPAADKAIRMQQQLNQLQRGLGRAPLSQKEKVQRMQAIELQLLAMGPLSALNRSSLAQRVQQLKLKL
jgi:DNA repair protein SbcC/Rad50